MVHRRCERCIHPRTPPFRTQIEPKASTTFKISAWLGGSSLELKIRSKRPSENLFLRFRRFSTCCRVHLLCNRHMSSFVESFPFGICEPSLDGMSTSTAVPAFCSSKPHFFIISASKPAGAVHNGLDHRLSRRPRLPQARRPALSSCAHARRHIHRRRAVGATSRTLRRPTRRDYPQDYGCAGCGGGQGKQADHGAGPRAIHQQQGGRLVGVVAFSVAGATEAMF